ncbi:hypothetical protein B484DRAFT_437435 [Ochromonadaceae sp. CCMP2298]|nr:hypothetical protein B484DRAFT_437435 [Ochromonadaceae sp. CCMP2298]
MTRILRATSSPQVTQGNTPPSPDRREQATTASNLAAIAAWTVVTWDGVLRHHFPKVSPSDDPRLREQTPAAKRLAKYAVFQLMKTTVIPDLPMEAMRARRAGVLTPPYLNALAMFTPFGTTSEETVEMFIQRLLYYMAFHHIWYGVIAMELEEGKHLAVGSPQRAAWIALKKSIPYLYEGVLETDRPDKNSVWVAVQYLQDMILAYLLTFRSADAPTTRAEVQNAIDTMYIPSRDMGGTYAMYKRMTQLQSQLPAAADRPTPYNDVLDAVRKALVRSGDTPRSGLALAIKLDATIEAAETRRLARGGAEIPSYDESMEILRVSCAIMTDEHELNKVHLHFHSVDAHPNKGPEAEPAPALTVTFPRHPSPGRGRHGSPSAQQEQQSPMPQRQKFSSERPPPQSPARAPIGHANVYSIACQQQVERGDRLSYPRGYSPEECSAWLTYEQEADDNSIGILIDSVEASLYAISLTDASMNARFSEETAVRIQLPRCPVCGFIGHDATQAASLCRLSNSKGQLVLDAVAKTLPVRREALWLQMQEHGALQGLTPSDLAQLWKIVSTNADAQDAAYRANAPQTRGPGQYTSQQRPRGGSPYNGPGAHQRFGVAKDASGRPVSLRDPWNRPPAPVAGAQWAQKGPSQDSRYGRHQSPGPAPPPQQNMDDLAIVRRQYPTFPYMDVAVVARLEQDDPLRARVVAVRGEREAYMRAGLPQPGHQSGEGSHVPVPAAPTPAAAAVPRVETLATRCEDVMKKPPVTDNCPPLLDEDEDIPALEPQQTSLFVCTVSDAKVATIWEAGQLLPTTGLTFQVNLRAPRTSDDPWVRHGDVEA